MLNLTYVESRPVSRLTANGTGTGISLVQPAFHASLAAIRERYGVPALAAALVNSKGILAVRRYLYSNAGYTVATAMAEKVSGRAWEELMQERIFEPLGLQSAGFGWPGAAGPHQPWGHMEGDRQLEPVAPGAGSALNCLVQPAGDIHTSPADMARYLQLHLRALGGEETLLDPRTARKLHRLQVAGPADCSPLPAGAFLAGAFLAGAWLLPQQDRALVVMTNCAGEKAGQALLAARRSLLPPNLVESGDNKGYRVVLSRVEG
jgi:CubicO group peptidase (beta-lactamase class C family)